jgi:hypothetical protein
MSSAAWISGMVSGFFAYREATGVIVYDNPPGVSVGQVQMIFSKYLKDHPKLLQLPARDLVLKALIDAFPPPKK